MECFLIFAVGLGIRHDPGSDLQIAPALRHHQGPDQNVEIQVAAPTEIPEGAGVRSAPGRFQLLDDLHTAHFGNAGDGSTGEHGLNQIEPCNVSAKGAGDVRDDMTNVRILLRGHEAGDLHGPIVTHPSEIIALEIYQHQMFRPLLLVAQEFGESAVDPQQECARVVWFRR